MKIRRVRVYPTPEQRQKLARWFGAARWTYNRCVEACAPGTGTVRANVKELRAHAVNDAALTEENGLAWARAVPYDVRDEGMRDYLKALKTSRALVRAGHAKNYEISFRSRKARPNRSRSWCTRETLATPAW